MPFDPAKRDYDNCPMEAAMAVIGGKWKTVILVRLLLEGRMRFSELGRTIPAITPRTLTAQLRELEADQLIIRDVFAEVPPRVEYSLAPLGQQLGPALSALANWSVDYLAAARA
ncbi:MAG: helix-turn-helix domain-containing protein [Pseudomonadota bacterium]